MLFSLQTKEKISSREIDGLYTIVMANMNKLTVDLNTKLKVNENLFIVLRNKRKDENRFSTYCFRIE